jgi:hypothetical protein
MHVTACAVGAADVSLLLLNEQPIAFLYAYRYRGHVYGLRVGYDEDASRDGIGNLLYGRVIEDSIARSDRVIDLGPGSLEAKQPLVSRVVPILRRTYGNPYSWRGLAWRVKQAWDVRRSRGAANNAAAEERAPNEVPASPDNSEPVEAGNCVGAAG